MKNMREDASRHQAGNEEMARVKERRQLYRLRRGKEKRNLSDYEVELCLKLVAAGSDAEKRLENGEAFERCEKRRLEREIEKGKGARESLIERNMGLIKKVVKKVANECKRGSLDEDDLLQEGRMALSEAIDMYDSGRGAKLSTFATKLISQRIWLFIKKMGNTVIFPDKLRKQMGTLRRAERELVSELNREPTMSEIASKLGWDEREIGYVRGAMGATVSLDAPLGDGDATFADTIPDDRIRDAVSVVHEADIGRAVRAAIAKLPRRERQVMEQLRAQYDDYDSPDALKQIGVDMGVPVERVWQVKKSAFARIRNDPSARGFQSVLS